MPQFRAQPSLRMLRSAQQTPSGTVIEHRLPAIQQCLQTRPPCGHQRLITMSSSTNSFVRILARGTDFLRLVGCVLAFSPLASAWAAEDNTAGLEEVVVTATKHGEERIQDTPIAVQAMSGQQLVAMGAIQVADYAALVPGFTYQDNGPGDKRYAIRGVSSTGSGTVGVYLDDVVITGENSQDGGGQQPDVMLFDMDRIEVLKGPQGTTFGSSSM